MPRVLYFEDDELLQAVITDLLTDAGVIPIVGKLDRRQAVQQLQSADYDLVLTDLQMPNFDGLDVLDWVQRQRPNTPVVALTGASHRQLIDIGCDPARFADFLFKPADLDRLLNTVGRLTAGRAGTAASPDKPVERSSKASGRSRPASPRTGRRVG
jgi:CheY-like chemotaxis protein